MEKLQIYSQCSSRTQHKPWGLGGGRQQRPKGSQQHYSASFSGPFFTLPAPLPAHANAHTPRRAKSSRKTLPCFAQANILPHTPPSCEVRHIKVESAHTRTLENIKASLIDDAYQAKTNQPPHRSWKTSNVSVQFGGFSPFRSSSSKKQEEKLTFLVSPWLFLLCGIF